MGKAHARARIFQRGGARERRGKLTTLLSERDADLIEAAVIAAFQAGVPFNRFLTIHWGKGGLMPHEGADATHAFAKCARDWLRRRGCRPLYLWVRENDHGDASKGDHVHMFWHLPAGVSLHPMQLRWIKRITGRPYVKGTILTKVIAAHSKAAWRSPLQYLIDLRTVTDYVMKGAPDASSGPYRAREWGEGGRVIGQRFGMSRELSRIVRPHSIAK